MRVSDEVEEALAAFIEQLRAPRDGIAWARRANLHVTLKFLGAAVESQKLGPVAEALERIANATAPFEVRTRGTGAFPNMHRPRVLWAGLEGAALGALARQVETAAAASGLERDQRPWSPHLTIGRVKHSRLGRPAQQLLERAGDRDFGVSRIETITLYRSHLSAQGSKYETLASFPFSSDLRGRPAPAAGDEVRRIGLLPSGTLKH